MATTLSTNSRKATLVILLLSFSLLLNIALFVFTFYHGLIDNNSFDLFSLNDSSAEYKISKEQTGEYWATYQKGAGPYNKLSIPIGSSLVPLADVVDKNVKLEGYFRHDLGIPSCWRQCRDQHNKKLLDIINIQVIAPQ